MTSHNAVVNAIGYALHRSRSHHAVIRVYDAAGNVIETHEPSLTASSVIAVMPASMPAVPNPSSRNEWPVHSEGGIHHVRPFKFEREPLNVIVWAIASHIPRKYIKPAKQHY